MIRMEVGWQVQTLLFLPDPLRGFPALSLCCGAEGSVARCGSMTPNLLSESGRGWNGSWRGQRVFLAQPCTVPVLTRGLVCVVASNLSV